MKLATSNIALSAYDHGDQLRHLGALGLTGLEVAPSRVWRDTWHGLTAAAVETYRSEVSAAGLDVVGLHSLFYDQPNLGLFRDADTRARTLDFMEHLSMLCRDLGGRTLIYGGGRKRGDMPLEDAFTESVAFFGDLIPRIEQHETVFCFEPLGPDDTDFINSVFDSIRVVKEVGHSALRVQLDAKALAANGELDADVFEAAKPYLVHVHANEPGFQVLGSSGEVNHAAIGTHLRTIGYEGFVSIEQKMIGNDPLVALGESAEMLKECYQ